VRLSQEAGRMCIALWRPLRSGWASLALHSTILLIHRSSLRHRSQHCCFALSWTRRDDAAQRCSLHWDLGDLTSTERTTILLSWTQCLPCFDLSLRGVSGGGIRTLSPELSFRALHASSFSVYGHVDVILLMRLKMKAKFTSGSEGLLGESGDCFMVSE
jgi:hypothetical protein